MNRILFINMASGFGGGEYQTEQLMRHLKTYEIYFFGKSNGKLAQYLKKHQPEVQVLNFWKVIQLLLSKKPLIIHAQDGRGAHIAALFKRWFNKPIVITRHVSFPLKRSASLRSYQMADYLVGVSQEVSSKLADINPNLKTIYGGVKPLQENLDFEQHYFFPSSHTLSIAQIGNFQAVKNFELTIDLAKQNPDIMFYLVGSGERETQLKQQAESSQNIVFIPFTPYIGSVLKQVDVLILPSHSEALPNVILEAYQYHVPVLAHRVGGIPELIEHGKTGFLIQPNSVAQYQYYLDMLKNEPSLLQQFKSNIEHFKQMKDFSSQRMAEEYHLIYQMILNK